MDKSFLTRGINGLFIIGAIMVGAPMSVQAASFDCAKASTNVEKMICADAELSQLDEQLAQEYNNTLLNAKDKEALKKEQLDWLKVRDVCKDNSCIDEQNISRINALKTQHLQFIAKQKNKGAAEFTDSSGERVQPTQSEKPKKKYYKLVYSENTQLCEYVKATLNQKLEKYGTIKIDGIHVQIPWKERINKSLFGFPVWKFTAPTKLYQLQFPFANFDINNDGKEETITLAQYGQDVYGTVAYIMPYNSVSEIQPVGEESYSFEPANTAGSINTNTNFYILRKLNEKPKKSTGDWFKSVDDFFAIGGMNGSQDIQFLKYQGRIYFTLTETDATAGFSVSGANKKFNARQFLMVGEYLGGSLNNDERNQDDVIKSACYFELILQY